MGNLDVQRERLIVEEDKLTSYGYFKPQKRELYFDEIKGCRENPGYLLLIPKDKQKKRIKVNRGVVGYDNLFSWISQTFEACDVIEQREVEQKKLNEKKNAPIKEINQEKLALAKKTAIVINTLGAISLIWGMISDMSDYAIFAILAIPFIAIFAILYFEGYIQMIYGECEFPSVIFALVFSSIAMITGAVGKYNIYEYSNVWLKTSLVVLSLLILLIIGRNQITLMFKKLRDYGSILLITFLFFLYSFGAVFYINCRYDNTTPQHYILRITEKGKNRSKSVTFYNLKVSNWGPKNRLFPNFGG
ncbi:hypothetical protein K4L44_03865 [Halosquirtibacter laminarini]|uniref:Uncharacterized protein n=1 Tax=Halosquirtibacter laminarini TaxID=3374600 RepID=A0AC61NH47_9BACT|nr:hypothetical protein K4L44_03865 [Prolixibacteraceae bacterium]